MKIVFLDIDGVLNSNKYLQSLRYAKKLSEGAGFLDRSLDDTAIRMVNYLCGITGARVVISSTWRESKDCIPTLRRNGLNTYVHGQTPEIHGGSRGEEIQAWLDENKWDKYVILDDDTDMLDRQQEYFVRVNRRYGITNKDLVKAIEILKD